MRNCRTNASSEERYAWGLELIAGLSQVKETSGFAEPLRAINDRVKACGDARKQAELALIPARVEVRHAEYAVDQLLRTLAKAAEVADGGRRGTTFSALFPEGLGPAVTPSGASQVALTAQFATRAKSARAPGIERITSEWLPRLEELNGKLDAALKKRDLQNAAVFAARATESVANEEHLIAVDRVIGEIRALFPKDRDRQEVFFPLASTRTASTDAGNDTPPPEPDKS